MNPSKLVCSVPGCTSEGAGTVTKHYFPKHPVRRAAWLQFCQIQSDNLSPYKHFICSRHFPEDAYQPSYRLLGYPRQEWRLIFDSVPTLNPPPPLVMPSGQEQDDTVDQTLDMIDMHIEDVIEGPSEIPTSKCRLCLSPLTEDEGIQLFVSKDGSNQSISKQLLSWFLLELEESPKWPSMACLNCWNTISQITQFKNMILESHQHLHSCIVGTSQMDETEEGMTINLHEDPLSDEDPEESCNEGPTSRRTLPTPNSTRIPRTEQKTKELESLLLSMDILKCTTCQTHYDNYFSLQAHMRNVHKTRAACVQCCNERRMGLLDILDHMEFHLDPNTFKCTDCGHCADSYGNLQKHQIKEKHNRKSYPCPQCDKSFPTRVRLERHVNFHLPKDQRPEKCVHCTKAFADKPSLRRHIERMHDVTERCVCQVCGKAFSSQSTLWTHVKNHEKNLENSHQKRTRTTGHNVNCSQCGLSASVASVRIHMRQVHGLDLPFTTEEMHSAQCEICGVEVPQHKLSRHKHIAHTKKWKECTICNIKFEKDSKWEVHMDKHLNRTYECPHCDKVNNSRQGRTLHIKSHHPQEFEKIARRRRPLAEGVI